MKPQLALLLSTASGEDQLYTLSNDFQLLDQVSTIEKLREQLICERELLSSSLTKGTYRKFSKFGVSQPFSLDFSIISS